MARQFRSETGRVETDGGPWAWLWCLLFGPAYFAARRNWTHVYLSIPLAFATASLSWWLYPLFVYGINARKLQRDGWVEVFGEVPRSGRMPWAPPLPPSEPPDDAAADAMIARYKERLAAQRVEAAELAEPASLAAEPRRTAAAGFGKRTAPPVASG